MVSIALLTKLYFHSEQVLFILSTNNLLQEQGEEQTSPGLDSDGATPGLRLRLGLRFRLSLGLGLRIGAGHILLYKGGDLGLILFFNLQRLPEFIPPTSTLILEVSSLIFL